MKWKAVTEQNKRDMNSDSYSGCVKVSAGTCKANTRIPELNRHPPLTHTRIHTQTDLVWVDVFPVQWAADWHVSCVDVDGEETFGILVSTGARQSKDMVYLLLCWNNLKKTHKYFYTMTTTTQGFLIDPLLSPSQVVFLFLIGENPITTVTAESNQSTQRSVGTFHLCFMFLLAFNSIKTVAKMCLSQPRLVPVRQSRQ